MIKEINSEFEIVENNEKSKFSINKNNLKINFYDEELILSVIDKKFNKKYRDILRMLTDDNDSDDNINLVLLKIDDLKNLIINKYYRYLNKKSIARYLKMLTILEDKTNLKVKKTGRGR